MNDRKRKQSHYKKSFYGKKGKGFNGLMPNVNGFFITCNKYEKETVTETYKYLNEACGFLKESMEDQPKVENVKSNFEKLNDEISEEKKEKIPIESSTDKYENKSNNEEACIDEISETKISEACNESKQNEENSESDDIMTTLKNETKRQPKVFQQVSIDIKNCLFIQNRSDVKPNLLMDNIFIRAKRGEIVYSKYIQRIIPVSTTTDSTIEKIKESFNVVWTEYTKDESCHKKKFNIQFKARHFDKINRTDLIPIVMEVVKEVSPSFEPIMDENDSEAVVIFINILCKVTCISLLENYSNFSKYNLHQAP